MSVPFNTDHPQVSLAYLPPTLRQTRSALVGAAVLLLGLAASVPFATYRLPRVNGFIPAFDAVISVTDLITAGLLLAQFSITRSRAIWALACGYLFSAAIVVAHALTFPGAFSPTGNLGVIRHLNFRVYLLWHIGLPVAIFAYLWFRNRGFTKARAYRPTEIVVTVGGVVVVALVSCIGCIALLPPVDPVAGRWLTVAAMLICAAALFVLWFFQRSVLDQWLMVVILAMIIELAVTGLIGGFVHSDDLLPIDRTRIATLGFYVGRLFSLVTSTFILIALLAETSKLYAGVARANTLANAVKASQALSSEIDLPHLIERLMKIAIENAGADRGLLVLPSGDQYLIRAEAQATGDQIVSAWTLEPDGTPDFVNQVWLEFSGQTPDFVRSRPEAWMTAIHPEDREMAARIFWEGVHSGRGFAMEARSLRAGDGTYRWNNMPEGTWKPHEKHGQLTMQSDLPDSVYAFPKQRKEPLTDAQHVRNAVARFDQVIDVSDADRALAFANIEKAATYYKVNLTETSWHELGVHPQTKTKEMH